MYSNHGSITRAQLNFIGGVFDTSKGSTLTVKAIGGWRYSDRKYLVECNLCSKDTELFPTLFESTKSKLNSGSIPCGCAKSYRWNKRQYEVRIKRECLKDSSVFLGFASEWKGNQTYILIRCCRNHEPYKVMISNFFAGKRCKHCSRILSEEQMLQRESDQVTMFMRSGKFSKDYKFKRLHIGANSYVRDWVYTCPFCSNDEYVQAGVCSGMFYTTSATLRNGIYSCRCANTYRWTEAQREYQIAKRLKVLCGVFIGWRDEGYINTDNSYFTWRCCNNHLCESPLKSFLSGNGCKHCSDSNGSYNGYFPERVEEQDYLYVMDFLVSTKVGRSFEISRRQGELRRASGLTDSPEILQAYTASHQVVYDIEQAIHEELRERSFQYTCDFTNECFTKDCWYILQNILEDYVSSGNLVRVK